MGVAKPATSRPRLPGVGRLGLVHRSAAGHLAALGWDSEAHIELLWSLSRSPDASAFITASVGLRVCNSTSPGFSARPARPET